MDDVTIRYIVHDVDTAIQFYTRHLNFSVEMHPAPSFAMLKRGNLILLLSAPSEQGGGGKVLPDGTRPEPGGWNRFQIAVENLTAAVQHLKQAGVRFRSEIIERIAGKQVLLDDPAGNPVELFEYYQEESIGNATN